MSRNDKLMLVLIVELVIASSLIIAGKSDGAETEVLLIGTRVKTTSPVVIGWTPATGPVGAYQVEVSNEPLVWHVVAYKLEPEIALIGKLAKKFRKSPCQLRSRAVNKTDRGPYSEASEWMRLEALDTN